MFLTQVTEQQGLFEALIQSVNSRELLQILLQKVKKDGMEIEDVIELFQDSNHEISVPISLFSSNLHPMEALCKYLIEIERLSKSNVARVLQRNIKTIWANYERSKGKELFMTGNQQYTIPLSLFQKRKLSIMEHVVSFLKQVHDFSNKEISQLLGKSPNSIAVLAKRAKVKDEL